MKKALDKKKMIIIAVVLVVIIGIVIALLLRKNSISATSMRVLRYEGTVNMEEDGILKTIRENLRLKSGNVLETEQQSLVSIGLDDTKVVTLDEMSSANFTQSGKNLNLNLQKGSLYFDVQKPLAADENFDIATSTMIVGIRGTSGWVSVEGDHESLILGDGHVHVIATNPVTGETKEIDVNPRQRLNVYLYNDRDVDSVVFELEDITERQLPEFVLNVLRNDMALLDRVCEATGWDKNWILGTTDGTEVTDPEPATDPEPVSEPEPEPAEPDHEHVYTSEVTKPATCSNPGEMTYTCECGDSYTEEIPATGKHTYNSTVTTQATCAVPGVMTYTCSVCGDTYTEVIPATGEHDFQGGDCQHPMICTVCGAEGPMGQHQMATIHCNAETHTEHILDPSIPGNTMWYIDVEVVDKPERDETLCLICGYRP